MLLAEITIFLCLKYSDSKGEDPITLSSQKHNLLFIYNCEFVPRIAISYYHIEDKAIKECLNIGFTFGFLRDGRRSASFHFRFIQRIRGCNMNIKYKTMVLFIFTCSKAEAVT